MLTGQALGDALAVAIEKKGVSKADVARAFGIKGPSVYDWINHGRIGKQHLGKLVAYFADVVEPSHWGITDATPFPIPVAESATDSGYRVALLDAEAAMGDGAVNNDYPDIVREIDFDPAYIRAMLGFVPKPGRLRLVTGRGDSMLPTIKPGDVVLVDTGCDVFDGDGLYLINTGHGQQIKRLQDRGAAVYVVSDNPAYESFPAPDETTIGGKIYLRNRLDRLG